MAYTPTTWVNDSTALNASNMNHIEKGIQDNDLAITEIKKTIKADSNYKTLSINTASFTGSVSYYKKNGIVCVSGKIKTNFTANKFTNDNSAVSESNKTILKLIATLPDEYASTFGMHCHALAENKKSAHIYIMGSAISMERLGPGTSELTSNDSIWFSFTYPVL
ncbi:MAG: hypothetical protein IJ279_04135 [Clostridia bacterium]|nr:hypothetical protein [Clostridia bacterium]